MQMEWTEFEKNESPLLIFRGPCTWGKHDDSSAYSGKPLISFLSTVFLPLIKFSVHHARQWFTPCQEDLYWINKKLYPRRRLLCVQLTAAHPKNQIVTAPVVLYTFSEFLPSFSHTFWGSWDESHPVIQVWPAHETHVESFRGRLKFS